MRIAIITGATSGIGYEAAIEIDKRFKSLDEIWVLGRSEEKLNKISKEIKHSVRTFKIDITKESELDQFDKMLSVLKPNIRMLFQAAGIGLHGRFDKMDRKEETEIVRLNCEALTSITSMCLPYMRRGSYIINIASAAAFAPFPGYNVYSASKAYVLSFSRSLRSELKKRRITVTAVCPGPVNTPFFDNSERYTKGVSAQKRKLMVSPGRVARRALFDAAINRAVSVESLHTGLFRIIAKFIPHGIITAVVKLLG